MKIKPRAFVSSVVEGFQTIREAARKGINQAGCEAILVNEDFPAQSSSSRNVCLDAVESADIFLLLIGDRGGWKTPSGKLVVEEEFWHAQKRKLPSLVFQQNNVRRDAEAQSLVDTVSNYITGHFRKEFSTPAELMNTILESLQIHIAKESHCMISIDFNKYMPDSREYQNQTFLRLVLIPNREEEIIDPIRLGSEEMVEAVYQVGHHPEVRLFSYQSSKKEKVKGNAMVIHQMGTRLLRRL